MEENKNIYLLITDKPSRLFEILQFNYVFDNQNKYSEEYKKSHGYKNRHIYVTSDEKVKVGDWVIEFQKNDKIGEVHFINGEYVIARDIQKKIILTTDPSLAPDVYKIDDEFLEWFVKNPTCEEVEVEKYCSTGRKCDNKGLSCHNARLKIVIPKEKPKLKHEKIIDLCGGEERFKEICKLKPKQETIKEDLMEFAKRESNNDNKHSDIKLGYQDGIFYGILEGAKWQQERMYKIHEDWQEYTKANFHPEFSSISFKSYVEQFKNK